MSTAVGGWGNAGIGPTETASPRTIFWGKMRGQLQLFQSAVIQGTTRDATNSPTTDLRAGLILAQVSPSTYTQYDPTATNGQQIASAILPDDLRIIDDGGNDAERTFAVAVAGPVKENLLLGLDDAARAQLGSQGFIFDDVAPNRSGFVAGSVGTEVVTDNAKTLTLADNGKRFLASGSGAQTWTLPALATSYGFNCEIVNAVDQSLTVTSAEGSNIITINNASASSLAASTASQQIGAVFQIHQAQTKWSIVQLTEGIAVTVT